MKLQLSVEAEEDMIGVYVHGASAFGTAQAERYFSDMQSMLHLIAENPNIAREREEFTPPARVHFHRSHVIVFTAGTDEVLIIRILGNRQNWARILSDGD